MVIPVASPWASPVPGVAPRAPASTPPPTPVDTIDIAAVADESAPHRSRLAGIALAGLLIPGVIGGILSATPAFAQAPPPPAASQTVQTYRPAQVTVRNGDTVTTKARKGDTYYGIARRFARDANADGKLSNPEVGAYAKDLVKANGNKSAIRIGQPVRLPVTPNASVDVSILTAAQKAYPVAGGDYLAARVEPGPVDTFHVRVGSRGFFVGDDLSGMRPDRWTVMQEEDAARQFPEIFGLEASAATLLQGGITEDGVTLSIPAGSARLVFAPDAIAAYDARGTKLAAQSVPSKVTVTTVHERVDFARSHLLTRGPGGELMLNLPPGTRNVLINQAQAGFDGSIIARDASGKILAAEYNTDFFIEPGR